ncbi:hypothetical protein RAMLITH_23695 [Ramlibacter sp. RBP-2]|uniref:Virulence sensor protein BvgS n=1 Tax=Ramlibacter lithotrophicus TaxID=2606681 RepID=A0A7X6DKG2_9BURK|nr:hypothetical protein [Ramlibacter lithotrophicus]
MPPTQTLASSGLPPSDQAHGLRGITAGFVAALLILAALGIDVLANSLEVRALSAERTQTRKLLVELNGLYSELQEAEIALLAYRSTGDGAHLAGVADARQVAHAHLAALRRLGQGHAAANAAQARIEQLAQQRLDQLARAAAPPTRAMEGALREPLPEAATLGALRVAVGRHEATLTGLLDARTANADARLQRGLVMLPAAGALSVGLLVAGFAWLRREITQRRQAAAALREANAQLADDLVERQRSAQELRLKNDELEVATARAQAADRVKSAFLATMSHELRTPLNSIIGFTAILLQDLAGPLNAEQRKQLEMVRNSSRHLLGLINDVLDISRIEAGELKVQREPVDLSEAIDAAVAVVRPLAERKQLGLVVSVAPQVHAVLGDRRRVQQILLNLLGNAVKFTAAGEIRISADLQHGRACVRVADTGVGIAADDLAQLFTPFRQVDTGLAREQEGSGLGLAICRRLAELMDGSMAASSEPGRGSVFTLTLPLAPGASA